MPNNAADTGTLDVTNPDSFAEWLESTTPIDGGAKYVLTYLVSTQLIIFLARTPLNNGPMNLQSLVSRASSRAPSLDVR